MNKLILLIICTIISTTPFAVETTKEKAQDLSTNIVLGEGEYTLQGRETINEAYSIAENLAKVDASKKLGQYFEVINLTDSITKERKEVVTSIAASISQYSIKSKQALSNKDQIIVKVIVEASASRVQLDQALERYINSTNYKKEILELKKTTALLELAIKSKDKIINQLNSASVKNLDTTKLQKRLYFANKEFSDLTNIFSASIKKAHRLSVFIDGDEVVSHAKKFMEEVKKADVEYITRLSSFLDKFNYDLFVDKKIDPIRGNVDVLIYPK
ncbi:hypothetical protein [Colwellia sp. Arc7-D]|uniref:hypothetical protein n=1 Tax=Colwellia sp. Arc7-D TaxID=2161872 RepID=UPI000D38F3E5|nr:hypothetical protein [Colwellia sp. Arc7-D]AWB56233.1 hypothetical protein DBO93_00715 [Colwellia sp. Arc7-D]